VTTVRAAPAAPVRPTVAPGIVVAVVVGWITVVLAVDAQSTLTVQRLLGVGTWCVLLAVLSREATVVRVQTAVVVVFATAIEFTFSPLLHVYLYRFHNVPMYVPPGHGLVYLVALSVARTAFVRRHTESLLVFVVAVGGSWAAYGAFLAPRHDALGAVWFLCLLCFLLWGPSRCLYIGAFLMVSYLELLGTRLGTWAWQLHDPTGLVSIGNPPSGAAGGYGWFDLAALTTAPWLLAVWRSVARRFTLRGPAAPA
jgi:hypothetical protein